MITAPELHENLFYIFVHAGTQGLEGCFPAAISVLPGPVVRGVRDFVESHPQPWLPHPLPTDAGERAARERFALAAQSALRASLEAWRPSTASPEELRVPPAGPLIWFVRWHVAEGDWVCVDEPLCELESAGTFGSAPEASFDIPAPVSGYLEHGRVSDGARVEPNQLIGRLRPET